MVAAEVQQLDQQVQSRWDDHGQRPPVFSFQAEIRLRRPEAGDLRRLVERRHLLLNELQWLEQALMEQHQILCQR